MRTKPLLSFPAEAVAKTDPKSPSKKSKRKKKSRKNKNKRPTIDLAAKLSEENRKGIMHVNLTLTTMPSYLVLPLHKRELHLLEIEELRKMKIHISPKRQLSFKDMYPYFDPQQLQVVKPDDDLLARAKAAKSTVLKRSLKGTPHLNPKVKESVSGLHQDQSDYYLMLPSDQQKAN